MWKTFLNENQLFVNEFGVFNRSLCSQTLFIVIELPLTFKCQALSAGVPN